MGDHPKCCEASKGRWEGRPLHHVSLRSQAPSQLQLLIVLPLISIYNSARLMAWGVRMNAVGWGIFAAIFAMITPLTLLVMREVIRRRRSALLGELLDTLFKGKENVATLEFARNKYGARATASAADQSREERAATRTLTRPYALLVSAIPYL